MGNGPVLTLDRGNSTLDCMLHGSHPRRARLPIDRPQELAEFLAGALPRVAVGVTVVPEGLAVATSVLAERGIELFLVPDRVPCPLRLRYDTPETLGADRWLSALAAFREVGAATVVDCGSATTVNAVDAEGTFHGGCIAPGLGALRAGMAAATPRLPAAEPASGPMPPRTTSAAVAAGLLLGYCGLIERLVAEVGPAAGDGSPILLTGGQAPTVLPHLRLPVRHVPDLVHRGLLLAWEAACSS